MDASIIKKNIGDGWEVESLSTIDSTNSELKRRAEAGLRKNYVLTSDCQTEGKGRMGRVFYSENPGIYFSMLFFSPKDIASLLTVRAAVSAAHAIRKLTGKNALIKWVNDIYVEDKKVCGILAEARLPEYVVLGIGINTGNCVFPEEIEKIAGSIGNVNNENLVSEIIKGFNYKTDFLKEYKKLSCVLGHNVKIVGTNKVVRAVDILENGSLLVEYPDGHCESLMSGEVSVKVKE